MNDKNKLEEMRDNINSLNLPADVKDIAYGYYEKGYKDALDENDILYGDDADRFVKNMLKAETEEPTEKRKQFMKELKENREAGYLDVMSPKETTEGKDD